MKEDIQGSSDYKIGKDGRRYPARRIHLGTKDTTIQEASYKGNIGIMELIKFHKTANKDQKDRFNSLMRQKEK